MNRYATALEVELLTGERQPSNQRLYCQVMGIPHTRRSEPYEYPVDECLVYLTPTVKAQLDQCVKDQDMAQDIPAGTWWSIVAAVTLYVLGELFT